MLDHIRVIIPQKATKGNGRYGAPQPLSLTRFRRNQYLPRVYRLISVPLDFSCPCGEFGVPESLEQQIDQLEELYESELDPQGRAFVPLADAHRRLGDLDKALAVVQQGLGVLVADIDDRQTVSIESLAPDGDG